MLARQRTGGPLVGNLSMMPDSRQTASRWGPSHCGQSSANNVLPPRIPAPNTPKLKLQIGCMRVTYTTGRFSAMWKGRSPEAKGFDLAAAQQFGAAAAVRWLASWRTAARLHSRERRRRKYLG